MSHAFVGCAHCVRRSFTNCPSPLQIHKECMVALSFASDAEANVFFKTAIATVSNRSKRRRSKKFSPTRSVDNGYNGSIAPQKPSGKFIRTVPLHPLSPRITRAKLVPENA